MPKKSKKTSAQPTHYSSVLLLPICLLVMVVVYGGYVFAYQSGTKTKLSAKKDELKAIVKTALTPEKLVELNLKVKKAELLESAVKSSAQKGETDDALSRASKLRHDVESISREVSEIIPSKETQAIESSLKRLLSSDLVVLKSLRGTVKASETKTLKMEIDLTTSLVNSL